MKFSYLSYCGNAFYNPRTSERASRDMKALRMVRLTLKDRSLRPLNDASAVQHNVSFQGLKNCKDPVAVKNSAVKNPARSVE